VSHRRFSIQFVKENKTKKKRGYTLIGQKKIPKVKEENRRDDVADVLVIQLKADDSFY
jgi:hypothetical protein